MSILESIIYGFISGFSEFSPVSSQAHQNLMMHLFGISGSVPLFNILVHLGMLAALIFSSRSMLARLRRDKVIMQKSHRRRGPRQILAGIYDIRVLRTASLPMIAMLICFAIFGHKKFSLLITAVFLVVNGVILLIPDYVRQGNKDGRSFSALDSIGLGILGGLSGLPGISRVGTTLSYSVCRGADKNTSYNWVLLLSIPALILMFIFDILGLTVSGLGAINFLQILSALIAFVTSFIGSCAAVSFMRYILVSVGLSGFALYSWGTALFSFIVYLLT